MPIRLKRKAAAPLSLRELRVELARLAKRPFFGEGDHAVEGLVESAETIEVELGQFDATHLTRSDQRGESGDVCEGERLE